MNGYTSIPQQEIACQQILLDDSSVFSVQWTTIPPHHATGITADFLLERYLAYIRRFTLSLIRPATTIDGVEFRFLDTSTSLISFTGPFRRDEGGTESLTTHICGGFLVQPDQCHRGELAFIVQNTADGVRVTLRLTDYCPLLLGSHRPSRIRKWLYRFTQAYIHKVVTVRFLARLYRELVGGASVRVVKASVRRGEEL